MKYHIKMTQDMGRGLYPIRNLYKGEIVSICEILVLSQNDTLNVNKTDLQYYTFKYNQMQDCLVLGDGEIFNHANDSNVSYELVSHSENGQDRMRMIFVAKRDIGVGEQLMINYQDDTQVDSNKYIAQKSLI